MQIIHLSYHVDDDYTRLKTDSSWLLIPNISAAREEMTWLSAADADDDLPVSYFDSGRPLRYLPK